MGKGFTEGGLSRRSLRTAGITFLAFPVWYPLVEEGGLRWPRAGDLPLYAAMIGIGLLFVWFGTREG